MHFLFLRHIQDLHYKYIPQYDVECYQYQLQIENAQAVLNNNNAALNLVDQALHEVINANEKLKVLNTMMQNVVKEVESEKEEKRS